MAPTASATHPSAATEESQPLLRRGYDLASALLVLVLSAPLLLLAIPLVRLFLLGIIILDIPLQIDMNIGYRSDLEEFGGIAGFNLSPTAAALALLYASWAVKSVTNRTEHLAAPWRVVVPLATYFVFVFVSTIAAADFSASLRELFLLCQMFLLYVYIVRGIRTRAEVVFVFTMMMIGFVIESGLMLLAALRGSSFALLGETIFVSAGEETGRISGTLGGANGAAAYLSMMIAPALCLLLVSRGFRKFLGLAGVGLGSAALITTLSRGGWTATIVSLLMFYGVLVVRRRVSLAWPLAAAGSVLIATLVFQDLVQHRLTSDDGGSAQSRIPLMQTAVRIIADQPFLGVGANNYTIMLARYTRTGAWDEWIWTVHNKYLLVWAENGIGALIGFVWFLVATIRQGWQTWKSAGGIMSMIALAFTSALVGHTIHLHLDLFSGREQVQLLWVFSALISVMHYLPKIAADARPKEFVCRLSSAR